MADVKWIKIATDIFNNRKIKQIDRMPDGDSILVIWIKLLCLAGTINNDGIISLTQDVPYDVSMLAYEFRRHESVIESSLNDFERFGMITKEDGFYVIENWEKYQNIKGLEDIREKNRNRKRKERERKRQEKSNKNNMSRDSHATVTKKSRSMSHQCHAIDIDIDKDIDKELEEEKEKEKSIHTKKESYQDVICIYNETCVSYPRVTRISDKRINAIKARLKKYSLLDFQTLFEKAEASDFLKGVNRDWKASFDWLINESNMIKVLEGTYDNRTKQYKNKTAQELDESYEMMRQWVNESEG